MNPLDWVLLVVVGVTVLMGLMRGLIKEVISLLGWFAAFIVSPMYAHPLGMWLPMQGASEQLRECVGFLLIFVGVLIVASFLAMVIKKMVSVVGLGLVDRLFGAVFGLLRGALIIAVAMVVIKLTPLQNMKMLQESKGIQLAAQVMAWIKPWVPSDLGKFVVLCVESSA
ncbi:MAG: CvpA family protein [Betaproteobacteria bacterium]